MRFLILNALVMITILKIFVIFSNVAIYQNPPSMEQALAITDDQKQEFYFRTVAPSLVPFVMGLVAFLFYRIDNEVKVKGEGG